MIKSKLKNGFNKVINRAGIQIITNYEYFLIEQNKALAEQIDDVLLSLFDLLSKLSDEITFVQIGANDGLRSDTFRDYIGWCIYVKDGEKSFIVGAVT